MQTHPPRKTTVRQHVERSQAELYELVLNARGIESVIVEDGDAFNVLVAAEDADQAEEELTAYDSETQSRGAEGKLDSPAAPNVLVVLVYWAVLLFFFAAARREALNIQWLEIGSAQGGLIRAGEWWRTVTALFLHASGVHLLSNLIFGSVFLLLLSQVLGVGLASLSVVAAGAAGNLLNALIRPPFHTSIGASTALFAAIGLLGALRKARPGGQTSSSARDWLPLAGGAMLLAFLGFSGEQTDILAHVFGFAAGVGAGWLLVWTNGGWRESNPVQRNSAWAAAGVVALAWVWGILSQT